MDYRPQGVCSQQIHFDIIDNKVRNVSFVGGCNGNLQGISRLIDGMDVNEAISRIEGIRCGFKSTSCPDQLARALKSAVIKSPLLIELREQPLNGAVNCGVFSDRYLKLLNHNLKKLLLLPRSAAAPGTQRERGFYFVLI